MPEYNPTKRHEESTWLYKHIQYLTNRAVQYQDTSMVIYACFESRNFLEKIEFDIIMCALTDNEVKKYFKDLKKMGGLNSVFGNKMIQEKAHTYISFINALCKAKNLPIRPLGYFDFKSLNRFKLELNNYCHLYSKVKSDFEFTSQFIQTGLKLPGIIFDHLKEKKVLDDTNGIPITGTPVSDLKGASLIILEKFRAKTFKSEQELIEVLRHAKNE